MVLIILQAIVVLILVFAILYEPIVGYKYLKNQNLNKSQQKFIYYGKTVVGLLIPTLLILLLIGMSDLSFSDIGLSRPSIDTDTFGYWISTICLSLGFGYFVIISSLIFIYKFVPPIRNLFVSFQIKRMRKQNKFSLERDEEKTVWVCSTLTIGMLKELLYKGVLISFILLSVPHVTIWVALVISSVLFALSKVYMGFRTVLANTITGMTSQIIAISMNSVLTLMFFHFMLVYIGKLNFEFVDKSLNGDK